MDSRCYFGNALEPAYVAILFESSAARTSAEIEEVAYQSRKSRVETMGFQDYFEAIEIYTFFPPEEALPKKEQEQIREVSTLPVRFEKEDIAAEVECFGYAVC